MTSDPENSAEPPPNAHAAPEPPPLPVAPEPPASDVPEIIWPPPPVVDRWAHRRGEPRLFALLWIGWLMLASAVALARLGPSGVLDPAVSRPVARVLFFTIMVGATILWPMVRLSQAMPTRRPIGPVLLDILILYLTTQIVIWPQLFLAYWPVRVLQAVSVSMLAWLLVVGGVLSWCMSAAQRCEQHGTALGGRRLVLMGACSIVGAGGVLLPTFCGWNELGERPDPDVLMLASGGTSVFELTRDRFWTGSSAQVAPEHWRVIWWTLAAGGLSIAGGWLEGIRSPVAKRAEAA